MISARPDRRISIAAIATRPGGRPQSWWPDGCLHLSEPSELSSVEPDVVVEAASREAVCLWGECALRVAKKFIVCSSSSLADDSLRGHLATLASEAGTQLVVSHGALGGIQAISSAALQPLTTVTHEIRKPPLAWSGTAVEAEIDLQSLEKPRVIYRGNARQAADRFPANANSVVTTALAGLGLDRTEVILVADPETRNNMHILHAEGAFGKLSFSISNRPMASNPRTSDMTALSVVDLLFGTTAALLV